ncbi:MAG: hypothetical protein GY733_03555 [bacterium]|nr:hypothetical protein [bacterium]
MRGLTDNNHREQTWTFFADLAASSGAALHARHPEHAAGLLRLWRDCPFAVTRRLALHAGARWPGLADDERVAPLLNDGEPSSLWDWRSRRETLHLLASLPRGLKPRPARALFAALRRGHPETRSEDEGERDLALRLAAVLEAGLDLPADLSDRAREVGADSERAAEELSAARDGHTRPTAHFVAPPSPAEVDFAAMPVDELTSYAVRSFDWEDPVGRAFEEYESELAQSNPARLLAVIHDVVQRRAATPAPRLAEGFVDSIPKRLADYVRAVAPSDQCADTDWLAAWDAVLPLARAQVPRGDADKRDAVSSARSHPTGVLTLALIERLLPRTIEPNAGLRADLTGRAAVLLAGGGEAGAAGTVLATHLFAFSVADHAWSARHVLPLLEWSDPARARGAWQGYLSNARVDEVLGQAIVPALVEACDHWEELAPFNRSLSGLVVTLGIDAKGLLGGQQARRAILRMGSEGRSHTAWILAKRLEEAGSQAGDLWRDRIGPWLSEAWPADALARDEETTDRLAWAATKGGDAFPAAVKMLVERHLLGRVRRHGLFQHELEEEECALASRYPEAALVLLAKALPPREDVVADPTLHWVFFKVDQLVAAIGSELGSDRRLDDLKERIQAAGR